MNKKEKYDLEAHDLRFGTEELCNQFLMDKFWGGKPTCDKCGNRKGNYKIKNRKEFVCSKCGKQFSILKGTIFEKTRVPLKKWFKAIYLLNVDKGGISSLLLAKYIGVNKNTAWLMLQKIRNAMKDENEIVLSGRVQADEVNLSPVASKDLRLGWAISRHKEEQKKLHGPTKHERYEQGDKKQRGRKKGTKKEDIERMKRERGGEPYVSSKPSPYAPFHRGAIVLGMVEEGGGKIILKKLGRDTKSITMKKIHPLLINHIRRDSILVTDENNVYARTHKMFAVHLICPHKKDDSGRVRYVTKEGVHTNVIENAWKHLRRVIRGTYIHVSYHHLDGYLNEYVYRWNRRNKQQKELFEDFIAMAAKPKVTLKYLVWMSKNTSVAA